MQQQGRLTEWNDERGFGFIAPLDESRRVFVHVSEFPLSDRRPRTLDLLTYSVETDDRGRLRASDVRFMTSVRPRRVESVAEATAQGGVRVAGIIAGLFLGIVAAGTLGGVVPPWVLALYGLLSVVLFAVYGVDKSAAQQGRWRVSESNLHLLALAGGWPGALVARQVFRHKTKKQPFQGVFWGTVIGNCLLLVVFLVAASSGSG